MNEQLVNLFVQLQGDNQVVFYLLLVLIVLGMLVKLVDRIFKVFSTHLAERRLRKLERYEMVVDIDRNVLMSLKKMKEHEISRLALKLQMAHLMTLEKSRMLMKLWDRGDFSQDELRNAAPFLQPRNDKVAVQIGFLGAFTLAYFLLMLALLGVYFALSAAPFILAENNLVGAVAIFVWLLMFGVYAAFLMKLSRPTMIAWQLRGKLERVGLLEDEDRFFLFVRIVRRYSHNKIQDVWRRLRNMLSRRSRR